MNTVTGKRYTPGFKVQAVELVAIGKPVPAVAEELSLGTSLLYKWNGKNPPPTLLGGKGQETSGAEKGRHHPGHPTPLATRMMIAQISRQTGGSVRAVCAALELPRRSFYHAAVPTATQSGDAELGPLV